MAVFFVFVDGIGVGENSPDNPLCSDELKSFSYFTGMSGVHNKCKERVEKGILFKPINANLDVDGLPQSGTGQVTLFSGKNASKLLGRHFGPFPHSKIKPLLQKGSLFHQVVDLGMKPFFINAYPDLFFKHAKKRNRWSATTLMTRAADIPLNRLDDVSNEKAITAEIIQSVWRNKLNLDVPQIQPSDASKRVLNALEMYDLVLFEYYLTDKAGHQMERGMADQVLRVLDDFLYEIIQQMEDKDTLVLTSDHGNLEDLSIKTHTRNPVPLFVKGDIEPFRKAESILDITPGIIEVLKRSKN